MKRLVPGLVLALLIAAPVFAGKPYGRVLINQTAPRVGDQVTFTVTQNVAPTHVHVSCGLFAADTEAITNISINAETSPITVAVAGDCTAALVWDRDRKDRILATLDFGVAP